MTPRGNYLPNYFLLLIDIIPAIIYLYFAPSPRGVANRLLRLVGREPAPAGAGLAGPLSRAVAGSARRHYDLLPGAWLTDDIKIVRKRGPPPKTAGRRAERRHACREVRVPIEGSRASRRAVPLAFTQRGKATKPRTLPRRETMERAQNDYQRANQGIAGQNSSPHTRAPNQSARYS
jgi:hypothetical protein